MTGMSEINRREFGMVAAMFAALGGAAEGQEIGAGTMGASKVFPSALVKLPNGTERWNVVSGTLATGEAVGTHVSVVPAGTPKVELHVIKHSELVVLTEGTVMFEHDGITEEVKAGSMFYVAYGTNHRVWNSGDGPAKYFVIQIGGYTKKA